MLKCLALPSLEQDYTFLLAKQAVTLSPSPNLSTLSGFSQIAQNTLFIDL